MSRRGRGGRNRNHGKQGGDRQNGHPQRHDGRNTQRNDRSAAQNTPRSPQSDLRQGPQGKFSFQSIVQPRRTLNRPPKEPVVIPGDVKRKYQVIFYDTLTQAKSDMENLRTLASGCDQLNIVIKAEGSMDDPELTAIGKLFCGAAWALIHERRRDSGWYEQPHE